MDGVIVTLDRKYWIGWDTDVLQAIHNCMGYSSYIGMAWNMESNKGR